MTNTRDAQGEIGGIPAFWREAGQVGSSPILYVHGVPVNSDIWMPFSTLR